MYMIDFFRIRLITITQTIILAPIIELIKKSVFQRSITISDTCWIDSYT